MAAFFQSFSIFHNENAPADYQLCQLYASADSGFIVAVRRGK
jgi:hypothetical protein